MCRFFSCFIISLCLCVSSCISSRLENVGYTISTSVAKKKTYEIWISPYLGVDLYHHDNSLVHLYGNIADSVVLKSNHVVYIFLNKQHRKELHQIRNITENYLK